MIGRRGFITGLVAFVAGAVVFGLIGFAIGKVARPTVTERGHIACNNGAWTVENVDFDLDFGSERKVYRFFEEFCRGRV